MSTIRIAIVNDTLMSLEVLRRTILSVPHYKLAWTAQNGAEAVDRCAQDTPDILLMDLLMPIMDGVEATRRIMAQSPCAILLVTASVNRFASKVFEAMGYGALDAINTPVFDAGSIGTVPGSLLGKIATITKLLRKSRNATPPTLSTASATSHLATTNHYPPLLLIGASTGGPQAIATILAQIPPNSPIAIGIVQHIDAQFAPGLAEWLSQQSHLPVRLSQSGFPVKAGEVVLAGSDRHLLVSRSATFHHQVNRTNSTYCPSIDLFFRSAAEHWPGKGVGVLLTGMGRDGAVGLKCLAEAGWMTIAQDQASCVVYGMPKAAIELQAATKVLPMTHIAGHCLRQLT
jgi:two-component system, chemotaxis family, response regulator WspF